MPLWLKIAYTAMVAVVVPFYLLHYGWRNILWLSDNALLVLAAALWLESPLLVSMLAVGTLALGLAWLVDFVSALVGGRAPLSIAGYMVDPDKPLLLRGLSLFHLALPPVMLWSLYRWGYDTRAWAYMSVFVLLLLPLTRLLTVPENNINWVYGLGGRQTALPDPLYVVLLTAAMPLLVFWPTHLLLKKLF